MCSNFWHRALQFYSSLWKFIGQFQLAVAMRPFGTLEVYVQWSQLNPVH